MRCTRGPVAERAKVQAARIAKSMHRRLRGCDAYELDALVGAVTLFHHPLAAEAQCTSSSLAATSRLR